VYSIVLGLMDCIMIGLVYSIMPGLIDCIMIGLVYCLVYSIMHDSVSVVGVEGSSSLYCELASSRVELCQ
jgi:hypothetical protein